MMVPDPEKRWVLIRVAMCPVQLCFPCTTFLDLHVGHESRHHLTLTQQRRTRRHREAENLPEAVL